MSASEKGDHFAIEQHGDVTIIDPAASLETLDPTLVDAMSDVLMAPILSNETPLIVVDLGRVQYFGSTFLSLLLRCWRTANSRGGQLVLANVSERARELLHVTSLDMIWPIFASRREAIEALVAD